MRRDRAAGQPFVAFFGAGFLGAAFAVAFGAAAFVVFAAEAFFAAGAFFAGVVFAAARGFAAAGGGASTAEVAAAPSVRVVFVSAARALPAAVWAPLALSALDAAIRALAALAACALLVVFAAWAPVRAVAPPSAWLTWRVRRDLRRAAAFGWIAPDFAARSSALSASSRATLASLPFVGAVDRRSALATSVFAALRRG